MKYLFKYNWEVRDQWLEWCRHVPLEELVRKRTGGVGSILETLFHIIDVEFSWIQAIDNKPVTDPLFEDYKSVEQVKRFSDEYRVGMQAYLAGWNDAMEYESVKVPWIEEPLMKGEVLRHVIAHEIHHTGQLSIWAREIGMQPISANFIRKGFMKSEGSRK